MHYDAENVYLTDQTRGMICGGFLLFFLHLIRIGFQMSVLFTFRSLAIKSFYLSRENF